MKLAVEVTTCTAGRAGIGYYTEHLVDALLATRAPGDDVVLIGNRTLALDTSEKWAGRLHLGGAAVRYYWMQAHAPRLLAAAGADLAVFPNYLAPLAAPCPYVNVVHDLALIRTPEFFNARKQALLRPLLPVVARGAVAVGTVSEASRRDVAALLGVPDGRILMLPGAPHPTCRPPGDAEVARVRAHYRLPRRYILSVGTLEPRKNLPALLRAFDQLRARDGSPAAALDLVIVGGRGWRDRSLRAELARRLDEGRVHSLGYVPESDLVALYGGAEVMAYPSHFEGFGLPVLESMACGTPVVASDVAALHEVSGGAAVLVRPNDETALAAAIAELVEDAAARSALRARGLARAAEFRWERTAESLWAFARTVHRRLHGRRAPAASAPAPGAVAAEAPPPPSPAGAPPRGADERDWAILATVAYADLFEAAIPVDDAAHACLGCRLSTEEVRGRVTAEPLARFVTLGATGYLTLRRREHLGARRAEGIRRTAELLDRHRRVIAALASLPFIRMLALSGGTAHRNARGGDDIDLFVVAAAGRAYTAYTLLFLASQLTRTRGIVCPNYLVDEEHLRIAYNHDLFTAHQAISLVPVAGTDTFARFLEANDAWVSAFYPNYQPRSAASAPPGMPRLQRALERAAAALGDRAEHLLSAAWRIHLGRRAAAKGDGADVVLEAGILKLHLSDHRRRVLGRFEARLAGLRREWEAGQPADPETPALPHTPVPTAR